MLICTAPGHKIVTLSGCLLNAYVPEEEQESKGKTEMQQRIGRYRSFQLKASPTSLSPEPCLISTTFTISNVY
ncbi:hypothetical protein O6P43_021986 [Quillaja saponaria]|uniref:Uncharacterized protein n=1 Tax=Quillaja saponaria TaxID=32244 RepID=A0AAD7LCK6_QUISA|nr:hypothetical protein O6P43_021986 [Quillaja saponaria]